MEYRSPGKITKHSPTVFASNAHRNIRDHQTTKDQQIQQDIENNRKNVYEEVKAMRHGRSVSKMRQRFDGSGLPETLDTFFLRLIDQESSYKAKEEAAKVHRGLAGKATPEVLAEFLRNLKGLEGKKEFLRVWVSQESQKGREITQDEGAQVIFDLLSAPSGKGSDFVHQATFKQSTESRTAPIPNRDPDFGNKNGTAPIPNKDPDFRNESSRLSDEHSYSQDGGDSSFSQKQWEEWKNALADETVYQSIPDTPSTFYGESAVSKSYISEAKKEVLLNAAFNYGTPDPYRREKETQPNFSPRLKRDGNLASPKTHVRHFTPSNLPPDIVQKYKNANPRKGTFILPPQITSLLQKKGYWFEDDDSDYSGAEDEEHEDPSLSLNTVFVSPKAPEYKVFEEDT